MERVLGPGIVYSSSDYGHNATNSSDLCNRAVRFGVQRPAVGGPGLWNCVGSRAEAFGVQSFVLGSESKCNMGVSENRGP